MTLADWKTLLEAIGAAATTIALFVAGLWAYWLFVKNRERFPRASVTHETMVVRVSNNQWLLHVSTVVKNSGKVLLPLDTAFVRLQLVRPLPASIGKALTAGQDPVPEGQQEVDWPLLRSRHWEWPRGAAEIEPGEQETLLADFFVDTSVDVVEVYSYVTNTTKKGRTIGWGRTTLLDLARPGPSRQKGHQAVDPNAPWLFPRSAPGDDAMAQLPPKGPDKDLIG